MAKDKKKTDKKSGNAKASLKSFAENPLVGEVVAAALVATAAALKDSNRARALASDAGEELAKLSKSGSERGSALWDMAVQIGRRSLEAMAGDQPKAKKSKAPAKRDAAPAKKSAAKPKAGKKKTAKAASR